MGNTVLDEYDAASMVEDMRLRIQNDGNTHELMIVVEGEDDEKALMKFFNLHVVEFFYTCNCLAVRDSMRLVCSDEQLKDRVIGIKDADFDYLKGVNYDDIPNLFLTDTHDMETMLLTPNVCRAICLETLKHEYPNLMAESMECLKNLSYIRFYNDIVILDSNDSNSKGINFNGIVLKNIIPDCIPKDMNIWLEAVKKKGMKVNLYSPMCQ